MKTYNYFILITLLLFLTSCQKEVDIVDDPNKQPVSLIEKNINNGRFVFSSRESLKATIEKYNSKPLEQIEQEFETYYENGFRSHRAIINPNNEILLAKFSQEFQIK